jgi:hypothetical protein
MRPKERGKERNPVRTNRKKSTKNKTALVRVTLVYRLRWEVAYGTQKGYSN